MDFSLILITILRRLFLVYENKHNFSIIIFSLSVTTREVLNSSFPGLAAFQCLINFCIFFFSSKTFFIYFRVSSVIFFLCFTKFFFIIMRLILITDNFSSTMFVFLSSFKVEATTKVLILRFKTDGCSCF
jgi:hypothetical protein